MAGVPPYSDAWQAWLSLICRRLKLEMLFLLPESLETCCVLHMREVTGLGMAAFHVSYGTTSRHGGGGRDWTPSVVPAPSPRCQVCSDAEGEDLHHACKEG